MKQIVWRAQRSHVLGTSCVLISALFMVSVSYFGNWVDVGSSFQSFQQVIIKPRLQVQKPLRLIQHPGLQNDDFSNYPERHPQFVFQNNFTDQDPLKYEVIKVNKRKVDRLTNQSDNLIIGIKQVEQAFYAIQKEFGISRIPVMRHETEIAPPPLVKFAGATYLFNTAGMITLSGKKKVFHEFKNTINHQALMKTEQNLHPRALSSLAKAKLNLIKKLESTIKADEGRQSWQVIGILDREQHEPWGLVSLRASQSCLHCHTQTKLGTNLGYLVVEFNKIDRESTSQKSQQHLNPNTQVKPERKPHKIDQHRVQKDQRQDK